MPASPCSEVPARSAELQVQPGRLGQQAVLVERLDVCDRLERVDTGLGRDAGALTGLEDLARLLAVRRKVGRRGVDVHGGELG